MTGAGHNSDAGRKLRSFIERVERLDEEIKGLNGDKSDVYKEAKGEGYDVKVMRKVVAARKMDSAEREEQGALFDMYWNAIHGVAEESPRVHVHAREEANSEEITPDGKPDKALSAETGKVEITESASDLPDNPVEDAATSGASVPASYSASTIKPPPSDEELEIPEFLRRTDGYPRSAQ